MINTLIWVWGGGCMGEGPIKEPQKASIAFW